MNRLSMIYNVSLIYLMLCGLKFVLMSPQLVAKAKTVKLREVGLGPSQTPKDYLLTGDCLVPVQPSGS